MTTNKSKISESEFAILSLVAEKPVYGYAIEQIIQERGMREWTNIGFSSIYYLLKKIEEKGWIIGKKSDSNNPGLNRHIFQITEAGLKICQEETIKVLSGPHAMPNAFLLGLSNWRLLNYNQIMAALISYRVNLSSKKEELILKKKKQADSLPIHAKAVFDYSIQAIQSEIKWVDNLVATLQKE
jgi:DNA-binding PadR family transcriptional regulator